MATKPKLDEDLSGKLIDQTDYHSKSGHPYADHAECIDTRKSTSGGIQFLGDKLVSWMSKKQDCTAMSLVEAEYVRFLTEYQLADMFTKALQEDRFQYLVRRIGWSSQKQRWRWRHLIPAESDSRIKKARELKTKTSANSDIQDLPSRYQVYQGRLLASFQDDAKYEHVGQDTRSQGGKDDKDKQGKDLKISESKTKLKDNDKG
ncbi:hypothetical protein Tco_0613925 [Tanacetum coccineum]